MNKYKELLMLRNKIEESIIKYFDKHNVSDEEIIYILTEITSSWTLNYMDKKIKFDDDIHD